MLGNSYNKLGYVSRVWLVIGDIGDILYLADTIILVERDDIDPCQLRNKLQGITRRPILVPSDA